MNKKVLMLTITLLVVSLIVVPTVSANGGKKTSTSFIVVLDAGPHVPYWVNYIPSEADPQILFGKLDEVMFGYKVNIGGMLIEVGPGVYAVTGGTTYVMDADFTYEGTMFFFNYIDKNYRHWMVRYTYTFLPASGIDGTLMMYARAKVWLGPPPRAEFSVNGHGTGDLKGVVVKAGAGPPILDPDYGLKVATHEGIIMGWD